MSKIKKRILFASPSIAGDITSPDFIQLKENEVEKVKVIGVQETE